jgi:hypothetical protein
LANISRQRRDVVPMTFSEIERITGIAAASAPSYRPWWSNNPDNSVMTKVWLDAGFASEQVDVPARKLVSPGARPHGNGAITR